MKMITIGLDISKSVFQVYAENGAGAVVLRKRLRRGQVEPFLGKLPPARIGIEACGSAHYWGRMLRARGHEVRLIPAAYVKPFVRRNKNDARDAAAICAAHGRPDMRFVPIKSVAQQASRGLEGARELLIKQHTQLRNCVRGQFAEFGIVAAQGAARLRRARGRAGGRADPTGAADGLAHAGAADRNPARRDRRAGKSGSWRGRGNTR